MIIFTMINKQDNLLAKYGKNHYSQNGEDGIISEIVERLNRNQRRLLQNVKKFLKR